MSVVVGLQDGDGSVLTVGGISGRITCLYAPLCDFQVGIKVYGSVQNEILQAT